MGVLKSFMLGINGGSLTVAACMWSIPIEFKVWFGILGVSSFIVALVKEA